MNISYGVVYSPVYLVLAFTADGVKDQLRFGPSMERSMFEKALDTAAVVVDIVLRMQLLFAGWAVHILQIQSDRNRGGGRRFKVAGVAVGHGACVASAPEYSSYGCTCFYDCWFLWPARRRQRGGDMGNEYLLHIQDLPCKVNYS